jgi:ABC-2 type transport system ATP-binding protein
VWIAGVSAIDEPARARRLLGVVTQFNSLDRALTVEENLYFHCWYFGFSHGSAKKRVRDILERFNLTERASAFPAQLSGGFAQRVQLARAFAHGARVLFLDEPTAGLDPQTRFAIWDAVAAMRSAGVTIVLSTHFIQEADRLCDRVAIIDHGKILVCGTPAELKKSVDISCLFEVKIDGPSDEFADRLKGLPSILEVQRISGGFRCLAGAREGVLPQIVDAANGVLLRDIVITEPDLETVFIKFTGRGLRN